MKTLAKDGPADVLKQQQAALAQSDADMAALQAKALASLKEARAGHVGGVKKQQDDFKGGEEAQRTALSKKIPDNGHQVAPTHRVDRLIQAWVRRVRLGPYPSLIILPRLARL